MNVHLHSDEICYNPHITDEETDLMRLAEHHIGSKWYAWGSHRGGLT